MQPIINQIISLGEYVWGLICSIQITDIFDMLIVSILLYYVYGFIRQRRAGKLAAGILVLVVVLALSTLLNMHVLRFILDNVFQVGILAVLIVFQPELRSALEKVGAEPFRSLRGIGEGKNASDTALSIREVTAAVEDMAADRTGALIVFERSTKLGDITRTGTVINADVNAFLLKNIFFNKAPMHDGAVVISNNRICAAGCFLPLSMNQDIIKDLGTRHRAGIGMSENSDAVVVIVSEETGVISLAVEGHLTRDYDRESLSKTLESYLSGEAPHHRRYVRRRRGAGAKGNEDNADTENDEQVARERAQAESQQDGGEESGDERK